MDEGSRKSGVLVAVLLAAALVAIMLLNMN